jgi:hypothetical protein
VGKECTGGVRGAAGTLDVKDGSTCKQWTSARPSPTHRRACH